MRADLWEVMGMKTIKGKILILALIISLSGCGTLLYPERMGQRHSNQVDIKVAVLDGIGLLFFIVPGVIAFAVDYSQGTIYLPPRFGDNRSGKKIKVVSADKQIDHDYLESMIEKEYELSVDLNADSTVTEQGHSLDDVQLLSRKSAP